MDKLKTGELIREARKGKNYTQSELGDLIGVTNKAVSRWENGESFPDIGVLENLAQVLDLKVQDIVTGEVQQDDKNEIDMEVPLNHPVLPQPPELPVLRFPTESPVPD